MWAGQESKDKSFSGLESCIYFFYKKITTVKKTEGIAQVGGSSADEIEIPDNSIAMARLSLMAAKWSTNPARAHAPAEHLY